MRPSSTRNKFFWPSFGLGLALLAGACGDDQADIAGDASVVDGSAIDAALDASIPVDAGPVLPTWLQLEYLKASNTGIGDHFGQSVALSDDGNTLVVGAVFEDSSAQGVDGAQDNDLARDSGAVYVFARSNAVWTQQAYLKSAESIRFDDFGSAVSLSGDGNTLAVGARRERSAATGVDGDDLDESAFGAGAVYVFTRSNGMWTQDSYLKASNTHSGDNFGATLSLSSNGETLAVSAPDETSSAVGVDGDQADNTMAAAGAVYVFAKGDTAWAQEAYLKSSNTDALDRFGFAISLSDDGDTLAVGAHGEDSLGTGVTSNQSDNTGTRVGASYVFTRVQSVWTQSAFLKASNAGSGDQFGDAIALSGDGQNLAIGASQEAGKSRGINGNQATNDAIASGAVYLFQRVADDWQQEFYVKSANADAFDNFGASIALNVDGTRMLVGAPGEASASSGDAADNSRAGAGAAYLFVRAGQDWIEAAHLKATNADSNDHFASGMALSSEDTIAIAAHAEASSGAGVGADDTLNDAPLAGACYLFGVP